MIKVTIGNNVTRDAHILDPNMTLKQALETAELDYSVGTMHLDGSPLQGGDLEKTFAEFGIAEKCFLLSVAKATLG